MKNPIKSMWIMSAAALVMAVCAAAQAQQDNPAPTGGGNKNIRLAVLEPTGKGLADDDKWMLSLVQGSIYADFIKYSGMNIVDNQNIEKIYDEWEKSMSGNYSDADRVKIGNLTNASHILSGTVVKTPNAFMLELAVTDLQSGERKASYTQSVSAAALENHSAIKEASADLLKQLGVNLTSAALGELKQAANIARIQAEEAMARGIVAKRQGTEVAALSYFFQAAALDPSLAEAVNRSSVMAASVSSGNIGDDTRNDIVWRKSWVKRLEETEQEIDRLNKTVSMPYTLYYSDEIIQGDINYQNETVSLTIKTNLYGRNSIRLWARSVEQALQAVYDGLEATGRKRTWNLHWPGNRVTNLKSFYRQDRNFTIVAELVNSRNQVIGSQEFEVGGYWDYNTYGRPTLSLGYLHDDWGASASRRRDVVFKNVKADGITDNLTIRIASVNGEAAETAAQKGVLQIKAMPKSEFDDNNNRFTFAYGEIKNYKVEESGGYLVIPDTIWDDAVISIGEQAFSSRSLTGVTIPNSVTSIGGWAFYGNGLTTITIGENVTLGRNVFYGGGGFEECYKNNGSKAGTYHFYTSSGSWRAVVTSQEIRGKKEKREILESNESEEAAVGGGEYSNSGTTSDIALKWVGTGDEKTSDIDPEWEEIGDEKTVDDDGWRISASILGGLSIMMNSIDSIFTTGFRLYGNVELFTPKSRYIRFGLTTGFGGVGLDKKVLERVEREINSGRDSWNQIPSDSINTFSMFFNVGAFVRWFPVKVLYLSGGGGWGVYGASVLSDETYDLKGFDLTPNYSLPIMSFGAGLAIPISKGNFLIDAQYHLLPTISAGFLSISAGGCFEVGKPH